MLPTVKIGRLGGVPVYIGPTWWSFPIAAVIVMLFQHNRQSVRENLVFLATIAVIWVCLTAHEFGHVWAAEKVGVKTKRVEWGYFGAVALLESIPKTPAGELFVALAGPTTSALLGLWLWALGHHLGFTDVVEAGKLNLWIALFNMIPMFPLDGGRVMRALLQWGRGMPRLAATLTALRAALVVGGGMLILALAQRNYRLAALVCLLGALAVMKLRNPKGVEEF